MLHDFPLLLEERHGLLQPIAGPSYNKGFHSVYMIALKAAAIVLRP